MKQTNRGKDSLQAWFVCLSIGLFFFYEFFQLNSFDVLNPIIRQNFHLTASELSLLSSIFIWANLLFLIPAGIVLDHFSVKKVALTTLAACILGTACLAWSDYYSLFVVGRFLAGTGNAFCFLSCVIIASRWFSREKQGLIMGLMVTLAFIGGMLAHAPFQYLIEQFSWRQALWIDVGMGFIFWVVLFTVVQSSPPDYVITRQSFSAPQILKAFLIVLKSAQTYLAGLYISLLNLPIMVLCALWGVNYLQVVYHVALLPATQIVSLIFLGSMIGSPLLGWISDKIGYRKPMMWVGVLGSILSLLPFLLHFELGLFSLSLAFLSLGFFTSSQVLGYPLLAESHLPAHVGEATAVASLVIMGGGAFGQMLFGYLIQSHAGYLVTNYQPKDFYYAMFMFPVAIILAGIVLQLIREPAKTWLPLAEEKMGE